MNFVEVIAKKRDGEELSPEEIRWFVDGAARGTIGDEQLAAMLMALVIRGATTAETVALVEGMRDSGEVWALEDRYPGCVDKHSSGGVGDSVSLVFAPLVASCGVPVAMMAGAGLGHTQGTLDKLGAIPGFEVARSKEEAWRRLDEAGACFAAQSERIAPADRRLYALRDLTGTVPSLPLIVASIMSKKLAVGAGRLVLDVKWGSGAFRKTVEDAEELARSLVEIGVSSSVEVAALVTDMTQPLGSRLGTASEVRAAVDALEGKGEARLLELSSVLAAEALVLAGRDRESAERELGDALTSGRARQAYDTIVRAHGGDPDPAGLASPHRRLEVRSVQAGLVGSIAADVLGWIAVALGAGRRFRGDDVDEAAGLAVHVGVGDSVEEGSPLATLEIGSRPVEAESLAARARGAFAIVAERPSGHPLVAARMGSRR